MKKEYPETKKVRIQFTKEMNEEVEFTIAASNDFGAVYLDPEHKRYHFVGDKAKCMAVLAKDILGPDRGVVLYLFSLIVTWTEA